MKKKAQSKDIKQYDVINDALLESAMALYQVSGGCLPVSLIKAIKLLGMKEKELFAFLEAWATETPPLPKKKTRK